MIMRRIVPGLLALIGFSAAAATLQLPFLKVGSVTYSNVTIIGANNTDLYFNHDQGIGNVKLRYVSPELQKRFSYDPAKAAEAEQQRAEADALYSSTLASNMAERALQARAAGARDNGRCQTLGDPVSDKSLLGKQAPPVKVEQWAGARPELEGKYVLVAFWEPWSAASRQSLTDLSALQKQFADKLVVVGVSTNSAASIEKMESEKPGIPVATDPDGKLGALAGVTSIPSVLLVDPNGIVRYQGHPAALTEKSLKSLFASE
jgi:cytochrome c biogenesis protein CcmG, thiol:disulfide interchange protein DsbE